MSTVREAPTRGIRVTTALHDVAVAGRDLRTAKQTHRFEPVADAERRVQTAVDAARELGIEWGAIGSALGLARGNAYQRYRRRPLTVPTVDAPSH